MKFDIKRIEIQNFRSIQDQVILDINEGIYSIVGENIDEKNSSNGCGKSSIVSAIYWCLTGTALTNEVLADEVVNITKGKDCIVTLYIDSDQGEIKIMRTRKDSEYGNNLFLFINDQDLSSHKITDTQETIAKLFKIPFNLLRSTIIMTSDMNSAFSELTPQQRVQTLESIRDYTVWDKVRDQANCDIKSYNKEINDQTAEINQLTGSYKTYGELITSTASKIQEIKNNTQNIDINQELNKFKTQLDEYISELTNKKFELQEMQNQQFEDLSGYRNKLQELQKEQSNKKDEVNKQYKSDTDKINGAYQAKYSEIKEKISNLKNSDTSIDYEQRDLTRRKTELEDWFNNPNCPTCGKPLTRTEEEISDKKTCITEIMKSLEKLNSQKETNRKATEENKSSLEALENKKNEDLNSLEGKHKADLSAIDADFDAKAKAINDELYEKEEKQRTYKLKIQQVTKEIDDLEQKIKQNEVQKLAFEQKAMKIANDLQKLEEDGQNYAQEIEKIVSRGKELRTNVNALEQKRSLSDYYYKLLGTKGELRPYLLSRSIAFINSRVQNYMSYFFKNTTAELYLNGANIDISIDAGGIKKSISSLSSGEAKRVNISIQLALYDLIQSTSQISFNLLFLDEIENSMDALGVQQLLNIVEDKADEGISSLFWITNNVEVMQHFNNKIVCRKEMGKTTISLEGAGV